MTNRLCREEWRNFLPQTQMRHTQNRGDEETCITCPRPQCYWHHPHSLHKGLCTRHYLVLLMEKCSLSRKEISDKPRKADSIPTKRTGIESAWQPWHFLLCVLFCKETRVGCWWWVKLIPSTSRICYEFYAFCGFCFSDIKVTGQKNQGEAECRRCNQFPTRMRPRQGVPGEKFLTDNFWSWSQA